MLFVSLEFLILYVVIFVLYNLFPKRMMQNVLLIIGGCVFYGWWSVKYLFLMIALSLAGYFSGILIEKNSKGRGRLYLILCIVAMLLCLGYFYY